MPARNKELDKYIGEIEDLFLNHGMSITGIACHFGCGYESIKRRLGELTYKQRIPSRVYEEIQIDKFTDREKCILLAAWVDTEGYIIVKNQGQRPEMGVRNTKAVPLKLLQSWFGGNLALEKRRNSHHNDCYRLYFTQNSCRNIIPKILPFLILKHKQAILSLNALDILTWRHRWSSGGGYKPQEILQQSKDFKQTLEQITKEVCMLNHRGR